MSDLVKRLQGMEREEIHALAIEQSDRIEQLERELAAEKALADRFAGARYGYYSEWHDAINAYRKLREGK